MEGDFEITLRLPTRQHLPVGLRLQIRRDAMFAVTYSRLAIGRIYTASRKQVPASRFH